MRNQLTDQIMRGFRVQGVLFDFDDTLTRPGALDFAHIRREVGCPLHKPILEFIAELPSEQERQRATRRLAELELEAAGRAQPDPAAQPVIAWLRARGLPLGILTRNGRRAVERALENFTGVSVADFEVIVSRDDDVRHKPDPDGVHLAARRMDVRPEELLMVGDFVFDILAGEAAGSVTVLLQQTGLLEAGYADAESRDALVESGRLVGGTRLHDGALQPRPDMVIADLAELPDVVRLGLPLPSGKFPGDLLALFLASLPPAPANVVMGPRVGRDVAALDVAAAAAAAGGAERPLLAVGCDPITFTTDELGRWAEIVNANDIVTCGAMPRWFFATTLFPAGSSASQVLAALNGLRDACAEHGIAICGGHTEVTDAVCRPVISGTMIGVAPSGRLVDMRKTRPGDALLLTKRVAVEGTALLAFELGDDLRRLGMTDDELAACRDLRDLLSIFTEATIAAGLPAVSGMHDVTEGGLATALLELAEADGHALEVDADAIPLYPQTQRLCELLKVDPLGLIGSGSLLITCAEDGAESLLSTLGAAGVEATRIGRVLEPLAAGAAAGGGQTVRAHRGGAAVPWPSFDVDEIARVLSQRRG